MIIDGINFDKEAVSKMSLEDFKILFTGKFKTVDIEEAAKLLGVKKQRRKYTRKAFKEEE